MNRLLRDVLTACIAATIVASCNGIQSQSAVPIGNLLQGSTPASSEGTKRSWMLREAQGEDLLYVSNSYLFDTYVGFDVLVFSFPSGKAVGTLRGFSGAGGECADKDGNVFITDWAAPRSRSIAKFAHGGSEPVSTLWNPSPVSCSVDPVTRDLAVVTGYGGSSRVAIYRHGRGRPKFYADRALVAGFSFCAYDSRGNLFVDGFGHDSNNVVVVELQKGARAFKSISLNYALDFSGPVQFADGRLVISDTANAVYRFAISGQTGKLKGKTPLYFGAPSNGWIHSFWIEDSEIAVAFCCPAGDGGGFKLYRYPAGGHAIKAVKNGFGIPWGITISSAKR